MTGPLDTAWDWFIGVRDAATATLSVSHLWDELTTQGLAGGPTGEQLETQARAALRDLDDIAVLYLFSLFEAVMRADTTARIAAERPQAVPIHPLYAGAMRGLDHQVQRGSVVELLNAHAATADDALREMLARVHEVREYRNWVAHGRRGQPSGDGTVSPADAKRWLEDFLYTIRAVSTV